MQLSIPWSSSVSLFVIEMMKIIYSLKCTVPFSFVVPLLSLAVIHCHSLSLFVTRCHSLSLVVPLVVIRYHSLSLDVELVCLFINDRFKMSCFSCLIFICVHCFFLKMMKLYKDISSAWIRRSFAKFFFVTDWRHKRLKNTKDLLLMYGEHFHGFSENDVMRFGRIWRNYSQTLSWKIKIKHMSGSIV